MSINRGRALTVSDLHSGHNAARVIISLDADMVDTRINELRKVLGCLSSEARSQLRSSYQQTLMRLGDLGQPLPNIAGQLVDLLQRRIFLQAVRPP